MNIEENIFKKSTINYNKLINYGFKKEKNNYIYSKNILNNTFRVDITINNKNVIASKVIDLSFNEEYINIKISSQNGEFVNKVREAYKELLIDIRDKCCEINYFIYEQSNRITKYIIDNYHDKPEYLWSKFPGFGLFRNKSNNKWYAIIMNIDKSKIDNNKGEIEILNIKLTEEEVNNLLNKKGFYKAYHMNSKNWITIILDNTIEDKEIIKLLNKSYNIINKNK